MLENFPQYGKAFAMRLVTSQIRATQTTWSLNCGNLVYHHTPDCNECFFLHFSERPTCVCWIWRNGETSKVKLTHRIPMPPVDASKYKPHTKAAKSTHCIISLSGKSDAMSIGLLPTIPAMHNAILRFLRIRYTCTSSSSSNITRPDLPRFTNHQLAIAITPPQPR